MAEIRRVTIGEWSEYELPSNAVERLQFLQDQVAGIPEEFRATAEFVDYSSDEGASVELFYRRPATAEEQAGERERHRAEAALKAEMESRHPGASILASSSCGAMVAYPGGRTLFYDGNGVLRAELNHAVALPAPHLEVAT